MLVYSGKLVYPIDHLVVQRIQQKGWNAQWFLHYVRFIVFMFVKHSLQRCVSKTAVHADLSVHLLYFKVSQMFKHYTGTVSPQQNVSQIR